MTPRAASPPFSRRYGGAPRHQGLTRNKPDTDTYSLLHAACRCEPTSTPDFVPSRRPTRGPMAKRPPGQTAGADRRRHLRGRSCQHPAVRRQADRVHQRRALAWLTVHAPGRRRRLRRRLRRRRRPVRVYGSSELTVAWTAAGADRTGPGPGSAEPLGLVHAEAEGVARRVEEDAESAAAGLVLRQFGAGV